MQVATHPIQLKPYPDLRSFLRTFRRRLDPSTTRLGDYERPNTRSGRPITQEEMAEAIGVSRNWYVLLENGTTVRPSMSTLQRLANALELSPAECRMLFCLAIPALGSAVICPSCGRSQTAYAQTA